MAAEGADALGIVTASNYSVDHDSKLNRDFVRTYKQVIPNATPEDAIDRAVAGQKGALDPAKTIDAQTREVHENMYIRRTELRNGKFANTEIASFRPPK